VAAAGLALWEREEISRGLAAGESCRLIARSRLPGRDPSTVSREVARHGGRCGYRAERALRRAAIARKRPKPRRLVVEVELAARVLARLLRRWSPRQIAVSLAADFPDRPELQVSHETIYQAVYRSLFVQGKGQLRAEVAEALGELLEDPLSPEQEAVIAADIARYLRRGHRRRQSRYLHTRRGAAHGSGRGRIPNMVLISARPAEVADRAVPGHWEGDLLVGRANKSQIATLVERSTRYAMLVALPDGRDAATVSAALAATITRLPGALRRSLTWDQGKEMAGHAAFSLATGVEVYFCDPRSPWQRGTNENTNGLLRQYFPKGADLSGLTQTDLDAVADELNDRPRETLGWRSPAQAFTELETQYRHQHTA
jgi:transposase, IS30 family